MLVVSIHAPARGATLVGVQFVEGGLFQSTPLREGRRGRGAIDPPPAHVSIHAPARGATTAPRYTPFL